jgi:hypothetical protein
MKRDKDNAGMRNDDNSGDPLVSNKLAICKYLRGEVFDCVVVEFAGPEGGEQSWRLPTGRGRLKAKGYACGQ